MSLFSCFSHTFDQYHDEDVKITGDLQEANGDWTVHTQIIGNQNGRRDVLAKVDYRLRKRPDWRVIDIIVEGVGLVGNFREQFKSIMADGGINRLLKLLHDKNAAGEPGSIK